jgi:hypothetical protein
MGKANQENHFLTSLESLVLAQPVSAGCYGKFGQTMPCPEAGLPFSERLAMRG